MNIGIRYAARSDVGMLREGNEDSAYAGTRLLAVADGMGGHVGRRDRQCRRHQRAAEARRRRARRRAAVRARARRQAGQRQPAPHRRGRPGPAGHGDDAHGDALVGRPGRPGAHRRLPRVPAPQRRALPDHPRPHPGAVAGRRGPDQHRRGRRAPAALAAAARPRRARRGRSRPVAARGPGRRPLSALLRRPVRGGERGDHPPGADLRRRPRAGRTAAHRPRQPRRRAGQHHLCRGRRRGPEPQQPPAVRPVVAGAAANAARAARRGRHAAGPAPAGGTAARMGDTPAQRARQLGETTLPQPQVVVDEMPPPTMHAPAAAPPTSRCAGHRGPRRRGWAWLVVAVLVLVALLGAGGFTGLRYIHAAASTWPPTTVSSPSTRAQPTVSSASTVQEGKEQPAPPVQVDDLPDDRRAQVTETIEVNGGMPGRASGPSSRCAARSAATRSPRTPARRASGRAGASSRRAARTRSRRGHASPSCTASCPPPRPGRRPKGIVGPRPGGRPGQAGRLRRRGDRLRAAPHTPRETARSRPSLMLSVQRAGPVADAPPAERASLVDARLRDGRDARGVRPGRAGP